METVEQIKNLIFEKIKEYLPEYASDVNEETPLIGSCGMLDSMTLVELCLALEDLASEMGFEFDWRSENAMSRSRSMFRTAGSIASEFIEQKDSTK